MTPRALVRARWPKAQIRGAGRCDSTWLLVSCCHMTRGDRRGRGLQVWMWADQVDAERISHRIDARGCGPRCSGRHYVIALDQLRPLQENP